jgi:hypothetical protein
MAVSKHDTSSEGMTAWYVFYFFGICGINDKRKAEFAFAAFLYVPTTGN